MTDDELDPPIPKTPAPKDITHGFNQTRGITPRTS